MTESKQIVVRTWLIKAAHDLSSARILARAEEPLLDTAIYHCQQAGEKAVKAFLVFHDVRFEKTHDIEELVEIAAGVDKRVAACLEAAKCLSPYASEFRYPGELVEPDVPEFEEALRKAEQLYQFVLTLLPREAHPTKG